ncbi:uncharacterized protein [Atheta coriaria]|uniref:uncharacterized protein isoform X3 n=1 Tax=Dalotia coriaria TaxID=877792 RepID=UPI0031F3F4DA
MDEILSRTGFGLYTTLLLSFGTVCYLTNALAYMNLPLYLPMISCDVHLSESAISVADFSVYIGMAVGGFFLSAVSDVVGRKTIIASSLLLIFFSVLIASFAYGPFGFILSMLLFGTGLEANMNVLKVWFTETIPLKHRCACIVCLDVFWILGIVAALGFYWLTLPILLQFYEANQRYLNWRISVVMSVFLTIILACLAALFLESPKYLLFERRPRDALEVIREIYAINKSKLFTTFEIADGELHGKIMDFGISSNRDIPNTLTSKRIRIIFTRIHKSLLVLVRKPFIHSTILAIIFRLILSMGHLPMLLFWSRSLNLENSVLVSDKYLIWHFEHPVYRDCEHFEKEPDIELYRDFAILCGCSIIGSFLLMAVLKCMDRKGIMIILASTLFLSGIFSILLGLILNNYVMRFAFSGMLAVTYSMACSCLDLILLEMFPTAVRSTAMGETMIFARLANVFVIKYLTASIQWLFISFGCLMEIGAILAFFLPKFRNKVVAD